MSKKPSAKHSSLMDVDKLGNDDDYGPEDLEMQYDEHAQSSLIEPSSSAGQPSSHGGSKKRSGS